MATDVTNSVGVKQPLRAAFGLLAFLALSLLGGCERYAGMGQAEIGAEIYQKQCAICHQVDGGGVPDLQPALAGSSIVLGDPAVLIEVITRGSSAPSLEGREGYGNAMAGFSHLSDQELAAVASHVRGSFGNQLPPLTVEQVAGLR